MTMASKREAIGASQDGRAPLTGRGGPGRGGGRKLPTGAKAVAKTVTMDPADIEFLVSAEVGDGELSRGIRVATEELRKKLQKSAKKVLA